MNVSRENVIVPWLDAGSDLRYSAFARVYRHLLDEGLQPVVVGAEPWAPGRARNRGARVALGEVLVFNDADTIVPGEQIREAARQALEAPGLVYGYTLYLRRGPGGELERELYNAPSMGAAAISRETFEELGGFDESYSGWGYEDIAFALAADERYGIRRVEGVAEHLWHGGRRKDDSPLDSNPFAVAANLERLRRRAAQPGSANVV